MELIFGDNVFVGHDTLIFGTAGSTINIGSNIIIGSRVIIVTGSHEFTPNGPCIEGPGVCADVTICSGAAISTGSIVLPGKTINNMAHVAAGSVVTHDVPAYTRVAGVPARVIKNFKEQ
ncbi:MAG: acyltransferase [Bacteroidales bacterium]|nr:acyltransferase [Bacteroidales bacterium]